MAIQDQTAAGTIQSVDRALRILEFVRSSDGVTLSELADEFELSKSTAHHYQKTLAKHGYIVREGNEYHLGLRLLEPAIQARERRDGFDIIKPKVGELADETGERAHFIVEENGIGIKVFSRMGEQGIQSGGMVGQTTPLHVSAAGKSILASEDPEYVEQVLDCRGLPSLTENTITSREAFLQELDEVREQGYAFVRGEKMKGLQTIGAPITTVNDDVIGAISVTAPVRRMENTHREYLPDMLLDFTEEISLRLEYADR
jgi:DNA-binding IclR family transcriptional regulator